MYITKVSLNSNGEHTKLFLVGTVHFLSISKLLQQDSYYAHKNRVLLLPLLLYYLIKSNERYNDYPIVQFLNFSPLLSKYTYIGRKTSELTN